MIALQTIAVAFAMFSSVFVPNFEWNEKNMKYMLVAFPLVGVVVGIFVNIAVILCNYFGFSQFFLAICVVIVPILVTGGIHIDGLIDTIDGLSSNQSKAKKLEILKDPHVGAFGVIWTICYFMFFIAVCNEILFTREVIYASYIIFFLSRTVSAITLINIKTAKKTGLASYFQDNSTKKRANVMLFIMFLVSLIILVNLGIIYLIFIVLTVILVTVFWYFLVVKKFGGTTGDLQGFLLQNLELFMFFALVFIQKVI